MCVSRDEGEMFIRGNRTSQSTLIKQHQKKLTKTNQQSERKNKQNKTI